jgi:hypothetical protein
MGLQKSERLEEVLINNNQEKQRSKVEFFDEKYKKVSTLIDYIIKKDKSKPKKKPFLKWGLIIIVFGLICLLIINLVPWVYVLYDNKTSNIENNEIFYYNNKIDTFSSDTNFSSFFESKDSNSYFGVNLFSLKSIYTTQTLILCAIIILGFVFTIIGIFIIKSDYSLEKYKLINCFFAVITTLLCIYLIFISVKFLGAEILLFYNANFISENITNLSFVFITPILLIIITSFLLKINTTILKLNIRNFEKTYYEKNKNESFKSGVNLK